MDYKELVKNLKAWEEEYISSACGESAIKCEHFCLPDKDCLVTQAATAITGLLARAESAEADRGKLKEKLGLASAALKAKVVEIPDTTEDDLRKAEINAAVEIATFKLKEQLKEAEARAEKAERERDAAVNDLKKEVMGKIWACDYCKKNDPENFQCKRDDLCGCSEWEWRGQKEE